MRNIKISFSVEENHQFQDINIYAFFKHENQFYQKISLAHALRYTQVGIEGQNLTIGFLLFDKVSPVEISEIKFIASQ